MRLGRCCKEREQEPVRRLKEGWADGRHQPDDNDGQENGENQQHQTHRWSDLRIGPHRSDSFPGGSDGRTIGQSGQRNRSAGIRWLRIGDGGGIGRVLTGWPPQKLVLAFRFRSAPLDEEVGPQ